MTRHTAILLLAALAACGGPALDSDEEVIALSRAAVEEVATETTWAVEPSDAASYGLGDAMMSDAVPTAAVAAVPAPELLSAPVSIFALDHGETLAHFARWSEVPVEDIAEASGLDLGGTYPVGTEVAVPVGGVGHPELVARRDAHRTARVEGYLRSRGGAVGTDFYTVRTGDSAWSIAKTHHGIPLWLLASYNPSASLDRLRPGDKLMVPVLADIVVDAE